MIAYLFKAALCSALFLLLYYFLLEKENMHRFKRFYLLFSVVFSFIIPFITIKTSITTFPVVPTIQSTNQHLFVVLTQPTFTSTNSNIHLAYFIYVFYVGITGILLYRFIKNVLILFYKTTHNPCVSYQKSTLVLMNNDVEPHTFLNYIFINKTAFENKAIEQEILCHELAHARQQHSIDILIIELLLVFAWFNPFLYVYKKAIQLNHEFLADESVVSAFSNTHAYQLLLLSKASCISNLSMTNHFNYSITKKRLIMLTKTTSFTTVVCRQIAVVVLLSVTIFIFSEKSVAQDTTMQHKNTTIPATQQPEKDSSHAFVWGNTFGGTKEGASQEMLDEYANVINKYKKTDENWMKDLGQNITSADKERLMTIFKQMNKEQQDKQDVGFVMAGKPLPKSTPTTKQFEAFKNPKIYGVWIDDKKVSNSVLQNYSNTDFAQVGVSKLYANARRNVNYYYQVNLMTKDYYQQYYKETMARRQAPIMITIQRFTDVKNKNKTVLRTM